VVRPDLALCPPSRSKRAQGNAGRRPRPWPASKSYCRAADHFFSWLAETDVPLLNVGIVDIDDVIAAEHRRGAWNRRTTHDYAQRLKAFFLFAEAHGWCRSGLAAGILAPRFMADETVPKGVGREDVLRLAWRPAVRVGGAAIVLAMAPAHLCPARAATD
jgi:hypothetical protein